MVVGWQSPPGGLNATFGVNELEFKTFSLITCLCDTAGGNQESGLDHPGEVVEPGCSVPVLKKANFNSKHCLVPLCGQVLPTSALKLRGWCVYPWHLSLCPAHFFAHGAAGPDEAPPPPSQIGKLTYRISTPLCRINPLTLKLARAKQHFSRNPNSHEKIPLRVLQCTIKEGNVIWQVFCPRPRSCV